MLKNHAENDIAQHFGVHRRTIERLVRKRQDNGTVKDLPRSWRPRVTKAAEDRVIRTIHIWSCHVMSVGRLTRCKLSHFIDGVWNIRGFRASALWMKMAFSNDTALSASPGLLIMSDGPNNNDRCLLSVMYLLSRSQREAFGREATVVGTNDEIQTASNTRETEYLLTNGMLSAGTEKISCILLMKASMKTDR